VCKCVRVCVSVCECVGVYCVRVNVLANVIFLHSCLHCYLLSLLLLCTVVFFLCGHFFIIMYYDYVT